MKTRFPILLSVLVASAMVSAAAACFADNPIVQTYYTADPAPFVYNDTLYLVTSHDEDDAGGFTMYNWLLFSTTDMANWTAYGIVAGVTTHSDSKFDTSVNTFPWADGVNAWAPQIVPYNNKFYLYVPIPYQSSFVIAVAVADQPQGPYVDPLGKPLVPSSVAGIDPTVFVDEADGGGNAQAYLYWGNPAPNYVLLNSDLISYSGSSHAPGSAQHYQEGPWLYKRNGMWYLGYASTCCPEGIGYAMSDSATGPWTNMGSGYLMMPQQDSSGNHPGIIDYKGTSYVFGFNYFLVNNLYMTPQYGPPQRRSVNVAQFTYNTDGTIDTTPWFTAAGVPQIAHLNPYTRVEAETMAWESGPGTTECTSNTDMTGNSGACWQPGVKNQVCMDTGGGMDVTNITDGDFIKVEGVDFGTGAVSFSARVASDGSGGSIELHLDSLTGMLVGTVAVMRTGGAQTWATQTTPSTGATGVHDLYFKFTGSSPGPSGSLFNFNYWQFTPMYPLDAGSPDSGAADASSASSSGGGSSSSSTSGSKGATDDAGPSSSAGGNSGCGCRAAGGPSGAFGVAGLLLPVAFAVRRRLGVGGGHGTRPSASGFRCPTLLYTGIL